MNDDGTMARVGDLARFCVKHHMKMITVEALIEYRMAHEFPMLQISQEVSMMAAD